MKYITDKKTLNEFLEYESKKYELTSFRFPIFAFRENQVLYKYNYFLRKLEYYTNCNKKIRMILVKLLYNRFQRKHSIFIPINVFDKGLRLVHIGPRLVNGRVQVGRNCTMHVNTCLVAGGVNDFVPKVGNNCILGIGSIIVGSSIIGDNIAVGAGAVVTKNFIEGNMTIAGVPAKKISDKTRDDWKKENRELCKK